MHADMIAAAWQCAVQRRECQGYKSEKGQLMPAQPTRLPPGSVTPAFSQAPLDEQEQEALIRDFEDMQLQSARWNKV